MPLDSIVGMTCFGTMFAGVIFIFIPRFNSRRLRLPGYVVGCFVGGGAMLAWGVLGLLFALRSPVVQATGTIVHVRTGTGRSSHPGPSFDIATDDGATIAFSSGEHAIYRMEGERAHVAFAGYDRQLLDLQILSGPDAGYTLHHTANNAMYWALGCIGLAILLGTWRSMPDGNLTRDAGEPLSLRIHPRPPDHRHL